MNHSKRKHSDRSRGAILVVVLVCLMVGTSFVLLLVRQAAAERREHLSAEQRLQAVWLAEAGIERAAAKLAADGKYTGETWNIEAGEIGASHDGLVTIEIKPVEGRPQQRLVRARAEYPKDPQARNVRIKEVVVDRNTLQNE